MLLEKLGQNQTVRALLLTTGLVGANMAVQQEAQAGLVDGINFKVELATQNNTRTFSNSELEEKSTGTGASASISMRGDKLGMTNQFAKNLEFGAGYKGQNLDDKIAAHARANVVEGYTPGANKGNTSLEINYENGSVNLSPKLEYQFGTVGMYASANIALLTDKSSILERGALTDNFKGFTAGVYKEVLTTGNKDNHLSVYGEFTKKISEERSESNVEVGARWRF